MMKTLPHLPSEKKLSLFTLEYNIFSLDVALYPGFDLSGLQLWIVMQFSFFATQVSSYLLKIAVHLKITKF